MMEDQTRPKILALDLDGTALHYDGFKGVDEFGSALRDLVDELNILKGQGIKIVIWTCRPDSPALREHLKQEEIPFDFVNEHPWNGPDNPRKIHADWYYDDKGLTANGISKGLAQRVLNHKPWWKDAPWV